jgi:uncharacterized membrane protein YkvI
MKYSLRGRTLKRHFACGSTVLTILAVVRFFALRAKKRTTKRRKVPLCTTTSGHRVSLITVNIVMFAATLLNTVHDTMSVKIGVQYAQLRRA